MRKLLFIAVCLLSFASCTKKSTSTGSGSGSGTSGTGTTPVSTFNITFKGKTYTINTTNSGSFVAATSRSSPTFQAYGNISGSVYAGYIFGLTGGSNQISFSLASMKLDATTAIGTYRCGSYQSTSGLEHLVYGGILFLDKEDGDKRYESDQSGKDTTSTITVSVSNATQWKGTFNIILSYNGSYYPATGDFDCRK
jgi:hypothetical protein